jgi:Ca2+/H+ antiporter
MNLLFTPVEVMAIVLTFIAIRNLASDVSFTWIEGLMLLVV